MASRPDIQVIGLDEDFLDPLQSDDDQFYGQEGNDEVSEPPAKKSRCDVDEDEYYSEEDTANAEEAVESPNTSENTENRDLLLEATARVATGCGCVDGNHFRRLSASQIHVLRSSMTAVDKQAKKQYILGILEGCSRKAETQHSRRCESEDKRNYITFQYAVGGRAVCRTVFCFVYALTRWQLNQLQHLVRECAVVPREHALKGKEGNNAFPLQVHKDAIRFIRNYAVVYGLPQPAARRGRASTVYLPAYQNYKIVHTKYFDELKDQSGDYILGYHAFRLTWQKHCPSVKFMTPREDVCATCEYHRELVTAARTEEEKLEASENFRMHVEDAQRERDAYRGAIFSVKQEMEDAARNKKSARSVHLTFDFAQNIHLPYHYRQVGPLFFKSPLKVQLFGVCNEGSQVQYNYIFHEGQAIGIDGSKSHGPNCVISMLHHTLEQLHHPQVLLHADNCVGQNKNKSVIAYLAWRCMTGRQESISLSFMRVGHTRCSVDGCFGLIKQAYHRSDCDTIEQFSDVIEKSAKCNKAVLFNWEWLDWDAYLLSHFKPIPGIRKYHHFRFSKADPGYVFVKTGVHAEELKHSVVKRGHQINKEDFPSSLLPAGISSTRQQYLMNNIREHCHSAQKDRFDSMIRS